MADTILLIRHGQTEWSKNGRHTSVTDLELIDEGKDAANRLASFLAGRQIDAVLSSPRKRALDTANAAFPDHSVEITDDLAEWDYGLYEGRTTVDIRNEAPGWELWDDGAPEGESPAQVTQRMQRLIKRLNAMEGTVACFAHGHILRAFGTVWIEAPISMGKHFALDTAAICELGHKRDTPTILSWNLVPSATR